MESHLNEQQISDFRDAFSLFDKNNDGCISREELATVLTRLGMAPSQEDLQDMIVAVDEDGNGTIEFDEFIAIMKKKLYENGKGDEEEELRKAFRIFDKDDNGFISRNELSMVMASLGEEMTEDEIDDMMKAADSNNDGQVDYEEFKRVMMST
ncbi:putative calmodulin-like protein 6 [Oryza glaberrima]|nr:putative calmodulin-like protein 6 [Oryza glaberrima]